MLNPSFKKKGRYNANKYKYNRYIKSKNTIKTVKLICFNHPNS